MKRITIRTIGFGVAAALAFVSCVGDTVPAGLRATPPGKGPVVVFDLLRRPLPEVPLPNDIATFADPTSRTGLRINASLVAPTGIEQAARDGFDAMEGWGTFQAIAVRFDRGPDETPFDSAIDLEDLRSRMQNDEHDFTNDPVYVINLATGVPAMLDAGDGNFPMAMRDPFRYWPNDPHVNESNLIFETLEEGAGLTQADYTPALDQDFDGILDHPNTLGPAAKWPGYDNLLTWYERETDTLILRPLLPLEEKTEYAVVLTDRLIGRDGQPVRSPFPYIHHPQQRDAVARAEGWLSDKGRAHYYGDIAGTGLDHVAFAWSFTTQPIHEDMRLLHDGLYGKGPFASFASLAPASTEVAAVAGKVTAGTDPPSGWQQDPACMQRLQTPFILKPNDPDIHAVLHDLYATVLNYDKGDILAIERAMANVDHVVLGSFTTPYLEGDPNDLNAEEARFHLNFQTGQGDVHTDTVYYWLAVPVTNAKQKPPFPVTLYGHGVTSDNTELITYMGDFAKQGIASLMIDMPEHGTVIPPQYARIALGDLAPVCLAPFFDALNRNRAHNYSDTGLGTGNPTLGESGYYWWTAHVFHVRDNVRQGTLDQMQAIRVLRSFDGKRLSDQDLNGDGKNNDLAGDFDGDGTVDVGGPDAPYFVAGESLGGIMSEVLGGIEPTIVAAAPMSGGGGLADIGVRSYGVTEAVDEQILSPLITSEPASVYPPDSNGNKQTQCGTSQRTVRMFINDGYTGAMIEIACLDPNQDDVGMTVVVTDVASKKVGCARTGTDGRFRVPIPSTKGDRLDIQFYNVPDAVDSYGTCNASPGAPIGRRIKTWEQPDPTPQPVGDPNIKCTSSSGCAQFRDTFFPVGSDLVAANDGFALPRQKADLRRFMQLVQAAIDPADPVNYAPYYMIRPLYDENGRASPPHALLSTNTIGDNYVVIATGHAFARAAGALPFLPPDAITTMPEYADYVTPPALYSAFGGLTPNEVLIGNGVVEGIARLERAHAGPNCGVNYVSPTNASCPSPPAVDPKVCAQTLFDPDWVSEGKELYDQPHPTVPLRLGRLAGVHPTDAASLDAAWVPREKGVPMSPDANAWDASAPVVALFQNYLEPLGKHTWDTGNLCRAFDYATYGNGIMARFFASGGKDLFYLSHPTTHTCLADVSCAFEQ